MYSSRSYEQVVTSVLLPLGHMRLTENMYPLTSAIRIEDNNSTRKMFVSVDRPQGGTSLGEGEIEIMQNRRITTYDGKGLGESYNEVENGEGIHTNNTYFVGL
jgi:hypothetical protein